MYHGIRQHQYYYSYYSIQTMIELSMWFTEALQTSPEGIGCFETDIHNA